MLITRRVIPTVDSMNKIIVLGHFYGWFSAFQSVAAILVLLMYLRSVVSVVDDFFQVILNVYVYVIRIVDLAESIFECISEKSHGNSF